MDSLILYFFITLLISVVMFIVSIKKRDAPKSFNFIIISILIVFFALGRFIEASSSSLEAAYIGVIIAYLSGPYIPLFLLLFLADYYEIKAPKWLAWVLAAPLFAGSILVSAPRFRGFFYLSIEYYSGPPIAQVMVEGTLIYYIFYGYYYLSMLACLIVSLWGAKKFGRIEWKQSLAVVVAIMLPAISAVLYMAEVMSPNLEFIPIALCGSLACLGIAIYRLNMLQTLPIAKDRILEQTNDAFVVVDHEGRYMDSNVSAKKIAPVLNDMRFGQKTNIRELFPGMSEDPSGERTVAVSISDMQNQYFNFTHMDVIHKGKKVCVCYILHDITYARKRMAELKSMATYDSLTQVYNRASFYELAAYELDAAREQKSPVAAFEIDIDFFKDVNDTYGHFGGDEILKAFAVKISGRLRASDIFGRVGGEEFNILLPNTNQENAANIANDLKQLIENETFVYDGHEVFVTISIGIAVFDKHRHIGLEKLLLDADNALYQAKNAGRNRVCIYK